ncbi:DNA-formamidopyrimidine glycosylase family protein [Dermacoccaceae bacterium W4C1]
MPEGDAVARAAARLHAALAGYTIAAAELRWGTVDGSRIAGAQTLEVRPRGKHLLHRLSNGLTVHSHLRMEGRWRITTIAQESAAQYNSPHLRARLVAGTTIAHGWKLGMLEVVATADESSVVGHLGPDLLGDDWDRELAVRNLLATRDVPIAQALLDQRNLAGLGTIFTCEPLFMERINPWTPVAEVGPERMGSVVDRAQRLLQVSMKVGSPRATGDPREPNYVFGRRGLPCRRCGALVRMATVGQQPQERVLCYCPRCQGGLAPHDDGGTQGRLGPRGSGRGNDRGLGRYR